MSSGYETGSHLRLLDGMGRASVTASPPSPIKAPTRKSAAAFTVRGRLRQGMARAPLSVPLTPFDASGGVDFQEFQHHVQSQVAERPGAVFVCCGPGEFSSLSLSEFERLVGAAVEVAGGRVPVVAGIGHRAALAVEFAQAAERAGADGGLLLLSSTIASSPSGVITHTRAITAGTDLPVLLSHGPRSRLMRRTVDLLVRIPAVIGVVDCVGDVEQAQRLRLVAPNHWLFVNGATTAEMCARPYASIGINACASAVHAFAPEIARSFFGALSEGDDSWVEELLREFFLPLTELSRTPQDYSVALPKAAAGLRGLALGTVRPPIARPSAKQMRTLEALLSKGLNLVSRGVFPN